MYKPLFDQIKANINHVITQETPFGKELWQELVSIHPADIAQFISDLPPQQFEPLFSSFPAGLQVSVFEYFTDPEKALILTTLDDNQRIELLKHTPIDELTDLFEFLPHEQLKHIFTLINKKRREKLVDLMKFSPESAGGIMDIDVIELKDHVTVENSSRILQHLQPNQELHRQIYVIDSNEKLIGHINLEDLVLNKPQTKVGDFLRQNDLVVNVHDDQEVVAKQMMHYRLLSVPVVDDQNHFIGVIPSETLLEVIEGEAAEDLYKVSAMTPIKQTYFETPFAKLMYERSYILIILLLAESFSSSILEAHEAALGTLVVFTPMLVSTGGNTSSQTSALAIQGIASGEISASNVRRFVNREMLMAFVIALILGFTGFIRVRYFSGASVAASFAVSLTLGLIVLTSVMLGSALPLVLKRFKIDPAFSAGPFLATVMDIFGILIFCYISKFILS